jgi:hypothetical protein
LTGDIWFFEDVGGAMNYSINGSSLGYFTYTLSGTTYTTSGGGVREMVLIPQESILLNVLEGGIQNMVSGVAVIDFPTNLIFSNTDYNYMEAKRVSDTELDEKYGTSVGDGSGSLLISTNTAHPYEVFGSSQATTLMDLKSSTISLDRTYLTSSSLTCFGSTQGSLYCGSSSDGMVIENPQLLLNQNQSGSYKGFYAFDFNNITISSFEIDLVVDNSGNVSSITIPTFSISYSPWIQISPGLYHHVFGSTYIHILNIFKDQIIFENSNNGAPNQGNTLFGIALKTA